ncbi:MFS transporter [Patescibacteria group bacterium]|nr:MFS transporter [Patescibacteria group bacterium]
MLAGEDKNKIDFYQSSPRGKILRAMTLNDITFWGADAFIFVIYALYVVNFIEGGSATHVGITIFIYYFTRALTSISVGKFFDIHKGYFDEIWGLTLTSFITGSVYMLLSQASLLWHIYIAMVILGFISAVNLTSWRVLFYNNIDQKEYGQTVGIYQTAVAIAYGLAAALGGIMGDRFGFDVVIFVGGLVMFVGGIVPLMVKRHILIK